MRTHRRWLFLAGAFVTLTLIAATVVSTVRAQTQEPTRLDYTTNNTDTNQITSKQYGRVYVFAGTEGDVVSISMIRSSGNLRPLIGLLDPRQPKDKQVITQSTSLPDGSVAVIAKFSLPSTGDFLILATRDGVDKGTTTGEYLLILVADNSSSDNTEVTPTKKATPRKTTKATATPEEQATEEATEQATEENVAPTPTRRVVRRTPTPTEEQPTAEATEAASGDTVQTFEVGTSPVFSVWNGTNLFVSNMGDGTVTMLDGDGNKVNSIKVGGVPFAMAWDGKRLWVADLGTSDKPGTSVNLFDGKGKKVGTFKVGSQPFSLSYDKDNSRMWIALYGDNTIVAVDQKGKILLSVDTATNPNTVLWTGDTLWATLAGNPDQVGNTVIAVDPDGNITGTYKVGKNPADLAWNSDDEILYVANYDDGNVMALNTDGKVVGTYKVGKGPGALAWDGTHLWVSVSGEGNIVALSNKGKVLAKVPVSPAPNGVTYDGTNIWAANQGSSDQPGNTITRIDVAGALGGQ